MKKVILIIDTGSSGMKCLLFDYNGNICFEGYEAYQMEISGLSATQKISDFSGAMIRLIKKAAEFSKDNALSAEAVALTSQRSSLITLYEDGTLYDSAMMWYDRRPDELCKQMNERFGSLLIKKTGSPAKPALLAPKILWKKQNGQDYVDSGKVRYYLTVQDFLIYEITGKILTDPTVATRSGLMNLKTRSWDRELLSLYGIEEEKMPSIVETGTAVGEVSGGFSGKTGLKTGIPVITAGGDQQASALGLGITEGDIGLTLGSGGYAVKRASYSEILDPGISICASETPGIYNFESSIDKAGTYYQKVMRSCGIEPPEYRSFNLLLEKEGPLSVDENLPDLDREAHLIKGNPRLAAKYIGYMISEIAKKTLKLTEKGETKRIICSGGLSRGDVLMQMLSDMMKRPVLCENIKQTTGTGAFKIALNSIGECRSLYEAEKRIKRARREFFPDEDRNRIYYKNGECKNE